MFKNAVISVLFLLTAFAGSNAKAGSDETWICLNNNTYDRKLILVEDIDNYDWDGVSRPDRNWHGVYLEALSSRCARAEINDRTTPAFAFVINGRDVPHKVRLIFQKDANSRGLSWSAVLDRSLAESILKGGGASFFKEGAKFQYGGSCTDRSLPKCSQYTIQNVQ